MTGRHLPGNCSAARLDGHVPCAWPTWPDLLRVAAARFRFLRTDPPGAGWAAAARHAAALFCTFLWLGAAAPAAQTHDPAAAPDSPTAKPTAPASAAPGFPATPALSVDVLPTAAHEEWWREGQILVIVRLITRDPLEALSLPLVWPDGVRVIEVMRPRTKQVRSYAGDGWVHESRHALFPLVPGPLRLPAFRATGAVRTGPDNTRPFDLHSQATAIEIRDVPVGFPDQVWRVAEDIVLTESWSSPLETARKGDILRREVQARAPGLTGAQILIPDMRAMPGLAVADLGETARTETTAEGVIGYATRSWEVQIGTEPVIFLPPLGLGFWDPVASARRQSALPAQRLEPRPADGEAIAARLLDEARARQSASRRSLALLLSPFVMAMLALAALIAAAAAPRPADLALRWRLAGSAAPEAVLRALQAWQRRTKPRDAALLSAYADASARPFASRWAAREDPACCARALVRAARAARLRALHTRFKGAVEALLGRRVTLAPPDVLNTPETS